MAWRRLLLALCALAISIFAVNAWTAVNDTSVLRIDAAPSGTPFVQKLTVSPSSHAYHAGLRTGDLIELRQLSPGNRFRWFTGWWWAGERVQLPVERGSRVKRVWLTTQSFTPNWDWYVGYAGILWMLLFAALISWRRADSTEARTLALLLICLNVGVLFSSNNWVTPWQTADAVAATLSPLIQNAGAALLATYAMLFARPATRLRRILAWLSYASAGSAALYGMAGIVGPWTLTADPTQTWYAGTIPQLVANALPYFFSLLCLLATISQTRGAERARISWASASLGLFYIYWVVWGAVPAFDPAFSSRLLLYVGNVVGFIAPIGLTYSLLSRRLLDVGFAINRAVVFSGVSIVIVGIFVLVEWMLSEWFSHASHTTNLTIAAAATLGLGLSVRAIHLRVDRVLDQVFFRKRHDDEKAIRTLAHEAADITEPSALLRLIKETLEAHADASFVMVALNDGDGHYGDVSENDPAIVALRSGRRALDLHTLSTQVQGEFAYPMAAHRRLVGALVVGPKVSGESYAPDESDAIMELARSAGMALDGLLLKDERPGTASNETVRALANSIAERLSEVSDAIAALSDKVDTVSDRLDRLGASNVHSRQ